MATAASGFTVAKTTYKVDGELEQTYTAPFTISGDGSHTLTVQSTDNSGVYEVPRTFTIQIASLKIISTSPLPNARTGIAYNAPLAATGGATPYNWSVAAGSALPAGLSLDPATGAIAGTPTTVGTTTFTARVTDALGTVVTREFTIAVAEGNHPPTANAIGPYGVVAGQSITLTGSGSDPDAGDTLSYAWDLDNDGTFETLDQIVTFSAVGRTPGRQNIALRVCDPYSACGRSDTYVTILSPITITTPSPLQSGTVGVPYSVTLAATGGTAPYTWSRASGELPPGLELNEATGEISGTPTAAGTFGFTIRVTDSSRITATKQFTLAPPPSGGDAGTPYPPTPIKITPPDDGGSGGGTPPACTNYALAPGSDPLPLGMKLDSATGVLSGTPTTGGNYRIIVQCTYNTNQTATQDFTITINNPAPTLTSLSPDLAVEGGAGFTLTVTGTGFVGTSKVRWNGADRETTFVSATRLTATITAADIAAPGTARVTVTNPAPGGGESNALTFTIKRANQSPAANAGPDQTVNEGGAITLDASGSTDPDGDPLDYRWTLLDGRCVGRPSVQITNNPLAGYDAPDNGVCRFRLTVSDGKGGTATDDVVVTINNVAPTVNAPSIAPAPSDEGSAVMASATFGDPGANDAPFTCTVDYGDGSGALAGTISGNTCTGPAHTYADNGSYTVTVTVTDKDDGAGAKSATHTVNNVAPSVGAITAPVEPRQVNTTVTASATFTDPGTKDTHTATWDWGDGSTSTGTVDQATNAVSGSHAYATPGVYTVTLTVRDKDGGTGQATFRYVVVYDPNGGFVTGGGWITSPAGACKLTAVCQGATGKANFGFVAKYKQGATTPTGQTQFEFKAGSLNFHSTAYDWLVVAGAKAQYKGTGTINGSGDYGFILTAIDGEVSGGGGTDKFRIKIWDRTTGTIVYDNQMDAADDAEPTTVIGGGSIVIHK